MRIRLINAGSMHGHSFKIVAIDGNPVWAEMRRDVVSVAPRERYDMVAKNRGVWLLHCHALHHMDAGMATLVQYEGFEPVEKAAPTPGHGSQMRH